MMDIVYIVIAAFLPSFILVYHFYKKDKFKPEPINKLLKTFFLGFALSVIVILPERFLVYIFEAITSDVIILAFLSSFFVAGLCEELLKLILIRFYIRQQIF